jgi:hypothetical protein
MRIVLNAEIPALNPHPSDFLHAVVKTDIYVSLRLPGDKDCPADSDLCEGLPFMAEAPDILAVEANPIHRPGVQIELREPGVGIAPIGLKLNSIVFAPFNDLCAENWRSSRLLGPRHSTSHRNTIRSEFNSHFGPKVQVVVGVTSGLHGCRIVHSENRKRE